MKSPIGLRSRSATANGFQSCGRSSGDRHREEVAELRELKIRGSTPDDLVRAPVELDLAPDRAGSPPKRRRHSSSESTTTSSRARLVLFVEQRPPDLRCDPEHTEEARRTRAAGTRSGSPDPVRFSVIPPIIAMSSNEVALFRHRGSASRSRDQRRDVREFRDHLVDGVQSAGIAVCQRTQDDAVHQAEDSSIRADPERQGSNGDRAKPRSLRSVRAASRKSAINPSNISECTRQLP